MERTPPRAARMGLAAVIALYAVMTGIGLRWGLPSRAHDAVLFAGAPWSGAEILARAGGGARLDAHTGADVDVNPLETEQTACVVNGDRRAQAEIYRRYRLFTRQPDEMITMMALSGMDPRALHFDPKLYQYGGLFIYPVGVLVQVCGSLGLMTVTSDLAYFLDHPEMFGRFYVVARLYAAAWGLLGAALMYAIAQRLGGRRAGVLAGLLFVLMPVVTCMAHEAKPHLPGAVLMLAAVWFGMGALDRQRARDWAGAYICCGAAVGMVLSAVPVLLLVPTLVGVHCRHQALRERHEALVCARPLTDYKPVFIRATLGGWLVAAAVYLLTNPYIAINAVCNRAVLASNFGNSFAMYEVARVREGAWRVLQLTVEGATLPVVVGGAVAAWFALRRRTEAALPLAVPAAALLLQFVLIGAGKPDEYGRFGVFYECALAIGTACILSGICGRRHVVGRACVVLVCLVGAWRAAGYLWGFHIDATQRGTRDRVAAFLRETAPGEPIAVIAEPAPYACPPLDFARTPVVLYRRSPTDARSARIALWMEATRDSAAAAEAPAPAILVAAVDDPGWALARAGPHGGVSTVVFEARPRWLPRAPISWANKPTIVMKRVRP